MKKQILLLTAILVGLGGCSRRSQPNIELIQDMFVSPAVKSQDDDPYSNMLPPEGTIPQGWAPYSFTDPVEAGLQLKNPIERNAENNARGKVLFERFCGVCHGLTGDGKGSLEGKWPLPIPNLLTERARGYKDGHIYHIVTIGRGLMGSYAAQVRPEDRWYIINYIRELQGTNPVLKDDGTPQ